MGADDYMHLHLKIPNKVWDKLGPNTLERLTTVLQSVVVHHAVAAIHYGDNNANVLGVKGQFADIWRKINPLKRVMWDDENLIREGPQEILKDLIGHCLLALQMYQHEPDRSGPRKHVCKEYHPDTFDPCPLSIGDRDGSH